MVKLGGCVAGFLEHSRKQKGSAQLTGWGICSPGDWLKMAENTSPPAIELRPNAVYHFPQLSSKNFPIFYPPNAPYYVVEAPSIHKYAQNEATEKVFGLMGDAVLKVFPAFRATVFSLSAFLQVSSKIF